MLYVNSQHVLHIVPVQWCCLLDLLFLGKPEFHVLMVCFMSLFLKTWAVKRALHCDRGVKESGSTSGMSSLIW